MDDFQREIDQVEKRTRRYSVEDGLTEISGGIVSLLFGVFFYAEHLWQHTSAIVVFNIAFPALIFALILAATRLVRVAKDRYVHPRTGFVAFKRPTGRRWPNTALAFVIGILTALLFARMHALPDWIPALEGLLFAAAFLYSGRKAELVRFPLEGLFCALTGFGLSLLHLDYNVAQASLYASLGLVFSLGGLVAFVRYLRQAPLPEDA